MNLMNDAQMIRRNENPTQNLSWLLRKTMKNPNHFYGRRICARDLPNMCLVLLPLRHLARYITILQHTVLIEHNNRGKGSEHKLCHSQLLLICDINIVEVPGSHCAVDTCRWEISLPGLKVEKTRMSCCIITEQVRWPPHFVS